MLDEKSFLVMLLADSGSARPSTHQLPLGLPVWVTFRVAFSFFFPFPLKHFPYEPRLYQFSTSMFMHLDLIFLLFPFFFCYFTPPSPGLAYFGFGKFHGENGERIGISFSESGFFLRLVHAIAPPSYRKECAKWGRWLSFWCSS